MKTLHQEEGQGPVYSRQSWYAGGSWESFEDGVVPGTMRVINGLVMRALTVTPKLFGKARVHWVSVDPEALRKVGISEKP